MTENRQQQLTKRAKSSRGIEVMFTFMLKNKPSPNSLCHETIKLNNLFCLCGIQSTLLSLSFSSLEKVRFKQIYNINAKSNCVILLKMLRSKIPSFYCLQKRDPKSTSSVVTYEVQSCYTTPSLFADPSVVFDCQQKLA